VEAYSDSELALATYCTDPSRFDILVADLTMPRLTGLQLARECRRLRPDFLVVICTGYTDARLEGIRRSGAVQAVIIKPLTRRMLAGAVREALDACG
jgi:CheY-like chemotaxis protein